jgi:hypothetical protein
MGIVASSACTKSNGSPLIALALHTHTCQPTLSRQLSNKEPQYLGQEIGRQGCREPRGVQGGGIHWLTPATRRGGSQASGSHRSADSGSGGCRVPGSRERNSEEAREDKYVLCIRSYGELRRRYAATRAQSAEPANQAANHTNLGTTGDPIEVVGGVGRTVARLASTTLVCFQS